ncbi:MAG: hypothetical protein M3T56_03950 [Chloroflexota bacterium]|nr:hypothetical protein [Chloroflexota bacterium]
MYPAAPRQGSHQGAMVFVGVIGVVFVVMFGLCGGNTASRTQPTPSPTATAPLPKLTELDSAWVSQTPPAQIAVGAETAITFKFRNTGKAAWARGTGSEASLGFVGTAAKFDPKMAVNWPQPTRPAVQTEEVVGPNEVATFTFKVKGVAPGTYRIDVRPLVVTVGQLRDQGVYTEVTVR